MKSVGVDLHKKSITDSVMVKADGGGKVLLRKRFAWDQVELIRQFCEN